MTSIQNKSFPHEIKPLREDLNKKLMNDFKGERYGFVQVGSKKWLLPAMYEQYAEKFYTYPLKKDDVWIVTFPRSGTTLCQELIWLVNNNLDYETASQVSMDNRFPFFEFAILHTERFHKEVSELNGNDPAVNEKLKSWRTPVYDWDLPSPRHLKTHLPLSLLPPGLTDTCKVIYVARNPKDVAVSYYHHNRLVRVHDYQGDFEQYWEYFKNDLVDYAPYWEHVKEAWDMRNKENFLFLFYEDLNRNIEDNVRRVAKFLGKDYSDEEIVKLSQHLSIDNFRKRVTLKGGPKIKGTMNDGEQGFLRKGKVGGNPEFDEKLDQSANEWIKANLNQTDLRFPV